jgi:hypothetical protein
LRQLGAQERDTELPVGGVLIEIPEKLRGQAPQLQLVHTHHERGAPIVQPAVFGPAFDAAFFSHSVEKLSERRGGFNQVADFFENCFKRL